MGRYTEYTEEILQKAKVYLESFEDEGDEIPSVASLSRYLGVARSTIYKWAEEQKDFSDTLDEILSEQERTLWNKGLSGKFNSTIAKLALANHGYSDKSQTDVTSGGEPLGVVILPAKDGD